MTDTAGTSPSITLPRSSDPIGFVRALSPRIRELSAAAEALSVISPEITDALRDGGIYSLMVPTVIGGGDANGEVHPSTLIDVLEELTVADGSVGWAVMAQMTGIGTWFAIIPEAGLEILLASPDYRIAGQVPPTGKAVVTDGGYLVSGQFGFASGSSSAGWFMGGFKVVDADGKPVLDETGAPRTIVTVVPRERTELKGGWDVFGLRATASIDYAIPEQFVPDDLVAKGGILRGDTLHRGGVRLLTALGHAAISLGLMRSSLEAFQKLSHEKFRPPAGLLASHETVQAAYAGWRAKAESASAWTHRVFASIFDVVKAGGDATEAQEADSRLVATHVAYLAAEITQAVYLLSGSEGLRNAPDNIIQRTFRDAMAASQHMLTAPHIYIEAGRIYLDTPGMQDTHRRILDHVFAPPIG